MVARVCHPTLENRRRANAWGSLVSHPSKIENPCHGKQSQQLLKMTPKVVFQILHFQAHTCIPTHTEMLLDFRMQSTEIIGEKPRARIWPQPINLGLPAQWGTVTFPRDGDCTKWEEDDQSSSRVRLWWVTCRSGHSWETCGFLFPGPVCPGETGWLSWETGCLLGVIDW